MHVSNLQTCVEICSHCGTMLNLEKAIFCPEMLGRSNSKQNMKLSAGRYHQMLWFSLFGFIFRGKWHGEGENRLD